MTNAIKPRRAKLLMTLALVSAIGTAICWTIYAIRGVEVAADGTLVEAFHLLGLGWLFAAIAMGFLAASLFFFARR